MTKVHVACKLVDLPAMVKRLSAIDGVSPHSIDRLVELGVVTQEQADEFAPLLNLDMRLEALVRQAENGVPFYRDNYPEDFTDLNDRLNVLGKNIALVHEVGEALRVASVKGLLASMSAWKALPHPEFAEYDELWKKRDRLSRKGTRASRAMEEARATTENIRNQVAQAVRRAFVQEHEKDLERLADWSRIVQAGKHAARKELVQNINALLSNVPEVHSAEASS